MNKVIVGQKHMVERLLIGLLGQGHILLEGVPGLAKTLMVKTISEGTNLGFKRIQFTRIYNFNYFCYIMTENNVTHSSSVFFA